MREAQAKKFLEMFARVPLYPMESSDIMASMLDHRLSGRVDKYGTFWCDPMSYAFTKCESFRVMGYSLKRNDLLYWLIEFSKDGSVIFRFGFEYWFEVATFLDIIGRTDKIADIPGLGGVKRSTRFLDGLSGFSF